MSVSSLSRLVYTNPVEIPLIRFSSEDELPTSYAVFRKIRECVSHEPFWKNLLINVNKEVIHSHEPYETIATSCVMNQYLLNILLIGEEQAKKVMDLLSFSCCVVATYNAEDSSEKIDLNFFHLLSGYEVLNQNKLFQDPSYQYVIENVQKTMKNSKEYTVPMEIFKENVREMKPSIYDYNHHVINALEAEINKNRGKVSGETSFLYHVAITGPDSAIVKNGSQEDIINTPTSFFHTFMLEQYYSPHENRDMIRLHQSWKDIMTLGDYYDKVNYDDQDQGCMGYGDAKNFFDNLRGLHSNDKGPEYKNLKKCLSACFNVDKSMKPVAAFRLEISLLTGESFRFVTSKINHQQCLHNIEEAINKFSYKA